MPMRDEPHDLHVSRETLGRLSCYVDLLRRWSTIKNLVAPSTLTQVWSRHIADSAQLHALRPDARVWVDMGSGAGFPGLVVAVLSSNAEMCVHLIESDQRKCAFLREVVRATEASAVVHCCRVEHAASLVGPDVDVVTARALAPLPRLMILGKVWFDRGATGLFLKGAEVRREIESLGPQQQSAISLVASRTSDDSRIVVYEPAPKSFQEFSVS